MIRKIKNSLHLLIAIAANLWYGFPSRKIRVIGVTGTDGKTTTTHLIYHILKAAGKKVAMISTIYACIGEKIYETGLHTTTPGPFAIQKLIKQAADMGDDFFVLEVTSHALDQNRVWGIHFELGVITNITHEHLDYHGNYREYVKSKARLLSLTHKTLFNNDDQSSVQIQEIAQSHQSNIVSFGLVNKSYYMTDYDRLYNLNLSLFNRYNYLAAASLARDIGISEDVIRQSLRNFKLPKGRVMLVHDGEFKVIVDFAHTPNAIDAVLSSIKDQYKGNKTGRIIHVYGAAGLRDKLKRPLMGYASSQHSDVIILTEEDYRTEDVSLISNEIAKGISKDWTMISADNLNSVQRKVYTIINTRAEAITKAINIAVPNDIIVITGKGHESSLCRGNNEYPWNDEEYVQKTISTKLKISE